MRSFLLTSRRIFFGLVIALAANGAQAQSLYGVNPFGNSNALGSHGLFYLNNTTGAIVGGRVITVPSRTISGAVALTTDPTTGTAYAVVKSEIGRLLVTLDLVTGNGVQIGILQVVGVNASFSTLAFRSDGQLFGVTGDGSGPSPETLFLIDKATAATTLATALGNGADGEVIAYNPNDNSFYHWSGNGTIVFENVLAVSPYTVTPITTGSTPPGEVFGAVWDPLSNKFLVHNISSVMDSWTTAGVRSDAQASTLEDVRGMTFGPAFPAVKITAGPGTKVEGTGGPATSFAFTIAKTPGPTNGTTTVTYTLTGTATTPDDYNALSGTINLTNAVPSKNITVLIRADNKFETNETLTLTLTGASNGYGVLPPSCAAGCETATVTNDDVQPSVRVNLASVLENAGFATATVTLSNKSYLPVTVNAFTADGSAVAPGDYTTTAMPSFVVPADATSATFAVPITNDFVGELNENFVLQIVSPVNATLGSPSASVGTIFDDDGPALSISDQAQVEGTPSAPVSFDFDVTIPFPAPPGGVSFSYATSNLSATAGSDYVAQSGTGSIPAGGTQTTISITVTADGVPEDHETFEVTLSNPMGFAATIDDGVGLGSIINDDVSALPGQLVISEFRLSGEDCSDGCGAITTGEFVEIANITSLPITVFTTDFASTGFSVAQGDGAGGGTLVFTIPNGTTIPARGHYLGAGQGYIFGNYGGASQADPDDTFTTDLADDVGLALFDTTNPGGYNVSRRLDSVGFTTDIGPNPLYVEGSTGLTPLGPFPGALYSFVRKYSIGLSAALQDTLPNGDSALDFVLVATDPGGDGPATAVLGGPSPENLASERELTNGQFTMSSPDGAFSFFLGPPKVLEFYRVFTNNGGALNSVRFKVTRLTGVNNPPVPGQADLRPTTSLDVDPPDTPDSGITYLGLTLEEPFPFSYSVSLPPSFAEPNGGLNSSLRPSSGVPVPASGTLPVTFRVEYVNSGPFFYWLVAQGK